jgi:hypothetical protein
MSAVQPWHDADLLQHRLQALLAAQAELRAVMGELAANPYRTGILGAGAPVLPSPDELGYLANILDRTATCVRHALVVARDNVMAGG